MDDDDELREFNLSSRIQREERRRQRERGRLEREIQRQRDESGQREAGSSRDGGPLDSMDEEGTSESSAEDKAAEKKQRLEAARARVLQPGQPRARQKPDGGFGAWDKSVSESESSPATPPLDGGTTNTPAMGNGNAAGVVSNAAGVEALGGESLPVTVSPLGKPNTAKRRGNPEEVLSIGADTFSSSISSDDDDPLAAWCVLSHLNGPVHAHGLAHLKACLAGQVKQLHNLPRLPRESVHVAGYDAASCLWCHVPWQKMTVPNDECVAGMMRTPVGRTQIRAQPGPHGAAQPSTRPACLIGVLLLNFHAHTTHQLVWSFIADVACSVVCTSSSTPLSANCVRF